MWMKRLRALLIMVGLFGVGCSGEQENFVFIPGPEFKQSLEISVASRKYFIKENIIIKAKRSSSGFIKVAKKPSGSGCFFVSKPPEVEDDVALNVNWVVQPVENSHSFDVNENGQRVLKFFKPGRYEIQARSALWCPPGILSNKIIVDVVE